MTNSLANTTALTPPNLDDPLKRDFRNFLFAVWRHLGLPEPTELQYDVAQYLQHGPRRLMVEAFRGVGKSWATVAFVLWLLYCNPQEKILVVSANATKASEFTSMAKSLIFDMPLLAPLKPRADQRQSMLAFDVGPARPDIAPSVKSVGITGQITGSRASVIVPDDIEVPKNSDTQVKREQLANAIKEFDAVIKPGGRILWLGTPQTEQSIYNELPARGFTIRIWPARFPYDDTERSSATSGKMDPFAYCERKYGAKLAPYIVAKMRAAEKAGTLQELLGTTTDPKRFSNEDLAERALSYGKAGFALQFMLDTALSDATKYPLKLADFIVHPLDPVRAPSDMVWASSPELVCGDNVPMVGMSGDRYHRAAWWSSDYLPYEMAIMYIDPSGKGADETAYAIVKALHGRLFLVASGGYREGYSEATLEKLMKVAKKHGVQKIIAEPNYGGGMFAQLLRAAAQQHYPCTIEDGEWSKNQKEVRIIETLEPILDQHKLVVSMEVIEQDYASTEAYEGDRSHEYRLMYQLTRCTLEKGALAHDDRLEALAGCVAYYLPYMSRDSDRAHLEAKHAALDAELEKFMQGTTFGGLSRGSGPATLQKARKRMSSSALNQRH